MANIFELYMISRFHYITQDIPEFSHPELTEFACRGGANWIQLRIKNKSYKEWLSIAEGTKSVCKKYGAKLIINDNVQIAKDIAADGVHLGKQDMNPGEARKILGNNFIIGGTANSLEDINLQIKNGVDYIGLGPFSFTLTKEKLSPILGLEGINEILRSPLQRRGAGGEVPIIAIGGINIDDIKAILKTGVHGIAVSSAINRSNDITGKTVEFIAAILEFSLPEQNG